MTKLSYAQQEFVDNLLSSLEKEQIPWEATWDRYISKPYNAISNKNYRGINELNLFMKSLECGYDDPRWMTFKQANAKGYKIKKGSVGTYIFNYALRNVETKELVTFEEYQKLPDEEKEKIKPFTKTYKVFNAAQIDGIPALDIKSKQITFDNAKAALYSDTLLKNIELPLEHGGVRAYYSPNDDKIVIPESNKFMDEQSYYAVLMHETAHATMHPARLNRDAQGIKGGEKYAIEELRAELTSAFLTLDIGFHFDQAHADNHKAYIQSWIKEIKEDPRVIFTAIKDAEGIREYMLDKGNYEAIYQTNELMKPNKQEEKIFKMEADDYPLNLETILQEKTAVVLHKLGVPICVECGYLDKDMKYYTNQQIDELTSKMSIDETKTYFAENGLCTAGHKIIHDEDLTILNYEYAHGFIDPQIIPFDQMPEYLQVFECMTNADFEAFDIDQCNEIQKEMLNNIPMTYKKMMEFRDTYLTDDIIKKMATSTAWINASNQANQDPEIYIKHRLGYSTANNQNNINNDTIEAFMKDNDIDHNNIQKMDLDEYLANKGLADPISDYLTDKLKGNRQLKTEKGQARFRQESGNAIDDYHFQRQAAIKEYRQLVEDGKVIPKTSIDREIEAANGNPENESTQAARRMLEKRGIDWHSTDNEQQSHKKIKNTVVINLFAGPGAGKTTCAWEIAAELKKLGYVTEYVPEYAKELVWDDKRDLLDGTLEHQQMLLDEQEHRVDRLLGKVDFVVTDSPSLLNLNFLKCDDQLKADVYKEKVISEFRQHNNFNLFINRGQTYETTGRIHTLEESMKLDASIKKILEDNHLYYGTYNHNTVKTAIDNCIKTYNKLNAANEKQVIKSPNKIQEISLDDMKNSISIAEYARNVLGMNVIKEGRGLCRLEEHDSCKIYPNNTFYRYSCSVGGSIIDFIKHFEECDTKEAIQKMQDYYAQYHPEVQFNSVGSKTRTRKMDELHEIILPEKADTNKHVYAYLTKTRGIKPSIVQEYLDKKILYEDTNRNCVFTGKLNGTILYATLRGSNSNSPFKQDVLGSFKETGIYIDNGSDTLVVNEAAIDQMSYMSMTQDPKAYNYLATCSAANAVNAVRFHMFKRPEAKNLKRIIIGLDNDAAGETNTMKTIDYLKENFPDLETCVHIPELNDFNDDLKNELNILASTAPVAEAANDIQA